MNVLSEMTALSMARPAPGAGKAEIAAWFESKALLHQHLADEGGSDVARERELAASAHRRALAVMNLVA